MESRHYTETSKPLYLTYIVLLLAVLRQSDATEGQNNLNVTTLCSENEYEHNGFCCDKCPPGFKLKEKCQGVGLRSKCEKCSDGTYQDIMNCFPNCFLCRKPCNPKDNEIEKEPCTNNQDRKCGCQNGYYELKVDDYTMSCTPCRKCGMGERETRPCGGNVNRLCQCKHNHYRVGKTICAQCTNCSSECTDFCPDDKSTKSSLPTPGPPLLMEFILVWVCLCALIGLIFIISLYIGVKHWKKRKLAVYSDSIDPYDPEKQSGKIVTQTHTCVQQKEEKCQLMQVPLDPVLPDCVPREIKTPEFIYFVLDIVPVNRFKELVRRLNVSEQDIDRAERDNRSFADAQYQMLMIWVDSGTTGGKNILPLSLLQQCVERLKVMNLTACAESIEGKYA